MQKHYVLTLIGDDRPGLVESLATVVHQHQGSWLESRMANLAGKFSGILLVSVAASKSQEFEGKVKELSQLGLSIRATPTESTEPNDRKQYNLSLLANDRQGILSELSLTLGKLGVNVEDLVTDCSPAPMSGEQLFHARAEISCPDGLSETELKDALELLADDLMVEIS